MTRAGTGEAPAVPVAFLGRTSTLEMQDPRASLRRQARSAQEWLPPGFQITAWYWDIESGALDLEQRSQGDAWRQFTGIGIPRDGGMADLLAHAASPDRGFAAVICEDIERSGRDTFNALKLEKELSGHGIPLFAADEPVNIEGTTATMILVRRMKQGVAEWYRIQLKEKTWKGLVEHSLDGWNIGPAPYGYLADRVPHPVPAKAAQGRTKTRLIPDPERGPVVARIFTWRVDERLAISTITLRLNADLTACPPPQGADNWAETTVTAILANPKYTGHMVYGRTRKNPGATKAKPAPPAQWIWSPEPAHPPLISRPAWDAAQRAGAERGNIRDTEKPTTQPGRRYILRSRIRHSACQHRMCGVRRPSGNGTSTYIYYKCSFKAASPRHAAAHPGHPATSVSLREDIILAGITGFLDQYVFGYDRAAMLAALIPATDAEHAAARDREHARLTAELDRITTRQAGLLTELEEIGPDTSDAARSYRARIRARDTELHQDRTRLQAQLDQLTATTPAAPDTGLLDELPYLAATLAHAPEHLLAGLLTALDIQILYRAEQDQATIWATLTDTTPHTITALLTDPRTTTTRPGPPPATPTSGEMTRDPIAPRIRLQARIGHQKGLLSPGEMGAQWRAGRPGPLRPLGMSVTAAAGAAGVPGPRSRVSPTRVRRPRSGHHPSCGQPRRCLTTDDLPPVRRKERLAARRPRRHVRWR